MVFRLGLASRTASVPLAELVRVAAAIGVQLTRDFSPIWGIPATVTALADADAIPPGVWPVFVVENTGQDGASGLHLNGANQPYALVQAGDTWSLTASHECLEMLVDPGGNKLVTSTGITVTDGKVLDTPEVKFNYLVEVADPSEDPACAYLVDDVLVSDFYTPNFFDPVFAPGVRYSFSGRITRPREILDNGYISWLDSAMNRMCQLQNFGAPAILTLPGSVAASARGTLRGHVDSLTKPPLALSHADIGRAAGGMRDRRAAWFKKASVEHGLSYRTGFS